jgi:uncharacterized protein YdhG (YjbR/CyaY superfamily)
MRAGPVERARNHDLAIGLERQRSGVHLSATSSDPKRATHSPSRDPMKTDRTPPRNIDEYIAGLPRDVQGALKRVRSAIRKAVPTAEEAISYSIPTFKLHGRPVIYFAGWKQHYSLYPSNHRLVAAFKDDLAPYEVNGKGTIRFPLSEPVPTKLIAGIAKFRAKEVLEGGKPKAVARKRR